MFFASQKLKFALYTGIERLNVNNVNYVHVNHAFLLTYSRSFVSYWLFLSFAIAYP